jgi:hypothetical protein
MDGWIDEWKMGGWVTGQMDRWVDGWVDGWMGNLDRWIDGWMDGWMTFAKSGKTTTCIRAQSGSLEQYVIVQMSKISLSCIEAHLRTTF